MNHDLDPYDGVPADTIPPRPRDPSEDYDLLPDGQIVKINPDTTKYVYFVVAVYGPESHSVYGPAEGTVEACEAMIRKFKDGSEGNNQYHIARVSVPTYVPSAK